MRKLIALLIIFALCLSMVACGVDEQYVALLEHLEVGNYEGVKTELAGLSDEFKAEQEELAKYRRYEALIENLENENFEAAAVEFEARLPAPKEPTYYEVEITLDNWQEYFEVVEEEDWQINGFGEAEGYACWYHFKLRDEFLQVVPYDGVKLSLELAYPANYHHGSANLETREVIIGEVATNIEGRPTGDVREVYDVEWFQDNGTMITVSTELLYWSDGRMEDLYVIEEMPTISRIQGTIRLPEE